MRQDRDKEKNIVESINNTDIQQYPLECSCDNSIREGNRLYLILSQCSDEWTVENVMCYSCNVRDSLERIQDDCQKSVVEATLRSPERVSFTNHKILELVE